MPALERGSRLLVEVDLPFGEGLSGLQPSATATAPDGAMVALRFLGRSPRVGTAIKGQSLFYMAAANISAPIGTPLAVSLAAAPRVSGFLLPASAVVWRRGEALVYCATTPDAFAAVPIAVPEPQGGGYFVTASAAPALKAGAPVVVEGAALLLSHTYFAKTRPAAEGGDSDP